MYKVLQKHFHILPNKQTCQLNAMKTVLDNVWDRLS